MMYQEMELGYTPNNLKAIRKAHHLTQADVAKIVGTSQRMVIRWETDVNNTSAHSDMSYAKWLVLLTHIEK
ncbi:hypothetical protein HMPREF0027_1318 [Actinobacillus ureae ATCC 25976]|uniref:HTH cro/C1-type domain-containing protein n=1 Tax=Actinobacillus ureae ATCC 25976 TaxID=887324 RepID=E8KHK1_9PAST|nr:helix-turn-helix transcriptional regulator [Actinobacillus ureae]EFX91630.1 hypothetical protein HMPREF0027_1318 [Actinobacillus ureae ATCC 25976]